MIVRLMYCARRVWRKITLIGKSAYAGCVIAVLVTALQGCTGAPAAQAVPPDAANPRARTAPAAYQPVTRGYKSQRPTDPLPWRERNERVTPPAKP